MSKDRLRTPPGKSVTVFFQGGLGNQLFQLAAGLDVADGNPSRLKLDFTLLNHSGTFRSPEILELLNPNQFREVHLQRQRYILPLRLLRSLTIRMQILANVASWFGIITDGKDHDLSLINKARNCTGRTLLLGYFQNLASIEKLGDRLVEVIRMRHLSSVENLNLDYLFIHLRRGDYLSFRDSYGIIAESDLIEIGNKIIKNNSIARVIVASEDYDAATRVKEKLLVGSEFCELAPPGATGIEILQIMVNAKVLVLANSSLSWWGAFLNQRNPIVFYPNPWFKSLHQPDFIPKAWIPFDVKWE